MNDTTTDDTRLDLGANGEVEVVETFDRAQMRAFVAASEATFGAHGNFDSQHAQGEVREGQTVLLRVSQQGGQHVGQGGEVQIDSELVDVSLFTFGVTVLGEGCDELVDVS